MNLSPVSSIGRANKQFIFSSRNNEAIKHAGSNPAPGITLKEVKIVDDKGRIEKIADKIISFYIQLLEIFFPSLVEGEKDERNNR